MYKDELVKFINGALVDELSASISYKSMSEFATEEKLVKALEEHSAEEYAHFNEILSFALNHDIKPVIAVSADIVQNYPTEDSKMVDFVQGLEKKAISDYKEISLKARKEGDLETEAFFMELMNDEIAHFDELSAMNNTVRGVNENSGYFKDLVSKK
jgi:ferritin